MSDDALLDDIPTRVGHRSALGYTEEREWERAPTAIDIEVDHLAPRPKGESPADPAGVPGGESETGGASPPRAAPNTHTGNAPDGETTPPALPLPLCHVRRPPDAWLEEIPSEARRVLEAARQGRAGQWASRVTHVIRVPEAKVAWPRL